MADNQLIITAGLNIPETVNNIQNELNKQVAPQLHLDIACNLNKSAIGNIQAQLGKIKNNVSVNIDTQLNKDGLDRQVKEIEKALNLEYPRGKTAELRNELKGLVSEYKKAFDAEGGYGEQAENHMVEIFKFASNYRKEMYLTNEELKHTQERIVEIQKEQQKMLLTVDQYNALSKEAEKNFTTVRAMMDNAVGGGRWTADANKYKFDKPYYWSQFAEEVNQINPLKGNIINEGDIVQGVKDLTEFMSKSFSIVDDTLDENGKHFQDWAQTVVGTVQNVTNRNSFIGEYFDIGTGDTDESIKIISDEIEDITEQTEYWRQQQELVQQQYEKTVAKIEKAKLSIDEVATREEVTSGETVNYNERFQGVMSRGITNAAELKEARDLLSAINNEYQILNAQMVSDLPQNVIENLIQGMNKADSQIKVLTVDYENLKKPSDDLTQSFERLKKLTESFDFSTDFEGETKESIEEKIRAYSKIKIALNETQSLLDAVHKAEQKAFKEESNTTTLENRIKKTSAALEDYIRKNQKVANSTKMMSDGTYTFAEKLKELQGRLKESLSPDEFRHLNEEIATFKKEADAAGLTISAFFRNMRTQMSYFIMQWVSVQGAVRILRSLVQEVTNVDTAMTELRKVTEATNEEFETFSVSAGNTGRELGASVSDVINATAEFARLGESLPDAEELGRVATLYKNVGDGIDITTASEDIISTMKAFKIEAKDAITIVDKLNEVGNSFAISSGGIGEALKRSASALAAGNNDLSESIALITTANTIAQDPTTVGQGIKTVSLRLRSTKTELEELGEDAEGAAENVSKLREQMLALTGVDIQLDDSTYKSTYQILLEISKVWGRLDDLSRSSVLEQLFGKRQANIGAAILENGELLEKVYKTSESASDGIGSAMREQEEYAKSVQYSIDTLKAAYQDFADTVINSDLVKNVLGTAQSFLEVLTKIIDKFGTLPTILTGIAAIGGVKGVGKPNMPKFVLLQNAQVDTPQQRAFQLLETPKAA